MRGFYPSMILSSGKERKWRCMYLVEALRALKRGLCLFGLEVAHCDEIVGGQPFINYGEGDR